MARIVAIGGEIGRPGFPVETLELDAEVVRLAAKRRPRVAFLPTATLDDPGYVAVVEEPSFTSTDGSWRYIAVRGLGLVDIVLSDPGRPRGAASVARRSRLTRLGLDDCTALRVIDDRWRILPSREGSMAHVVSKSGAVRELPPSARLRPLRELAPRTG